MIGYNHRVTIEYLGAGQDNYGTPNGTWTTLISRAPANVQDVMPSRDERVAEGGLAINSRRTRIRMRWRADITSAMRVTVHADSDLVMQIVGGPADIGMGRKREIEIMAEKIST